TVFNFPYLCCPWDAASLREVIDGTLSFHAAAGAPATWVLSNHDVDRHVSRYGRADTSFALDRRDHSQPVDLALGTRRARAAALPHPDRPSRARRPRLPAHPLPPRPPPPPHRVPPGHLHDLPPGHVLDVSPGHLHDVPPGCSHYLASRPRRRPGLHSWLAHLH